MSDDDKLNINRREALLGLATVPVAGAFGIAATVKGQHDDAKLQERVERSERILREIDVTPSLPPSTGPMSGDPIRIGIIGFGGRGEYLAAALGFAPQSWMDRMRERAESNPRNTLFADYLAQDSQNVQLTAVCDAFSVRRESGVAAGSTDGVTTRSYRDYRQLLEDPNVDAVVIATPDHLHAPIGIAALDAGKHVYIEKCMTHKLGETYALYDAVKASDRVFQVGHQNRQTRSYLTARDLIQNNVLGHVSLVQTNTNRNGDGGAWQWDIHPDGNPDTIDWDSFLGDAPDIEFSPEHFFRWRKYWPYGTGLSGDLLTHEFDRINCVLDMGIPQYCMATGGIYTNRDGREVPDVMQVVMEYPEFSTGSSREPGKEKGMSLMYSATLGSEYSRGTLLMGHDATLLLGNTLEVVAERNSTRYAYLLEDGTVVTDEPMYVYNPAAGSGYDAMTGATEKYFADKGLMHTYRDGKRVDATFLHMREWLSGIRNGTQVSCGIEEGFQEAIAAHMSTLSLRLHRRIEWDPVERRIANVEPDELDRLGMA